jgi:hypothetical protein
MAEEYCWAITQAAGRHAAADQVTVCWSLYIADHMYNEGRLARYVPNVTTE